MFDWTKKDSNKTASQGVICGPSGPIPEGALTISLSTVSPPSLFVSDLGKRGLRMEKGISYDLGNLYTQKQINDSYELKTWVSSGHILLSVGVGTTPSPEPITFSGSLAIGSVILQAKDAGGTIRDILASPDPIVSGKYALSTKDSHGKAEHWNGSVTLGTPVTINFSGATSAILINHIGNVVGENLLVSFDGGAKFKTLTRGQFFTLEATHSSIILQANVGTVPYEIVAVV